MWAAPCDPEKDNRFQIMDGNPNHIILRVVYDLRSVLKPSFEWRNTHWKWWMMVDMKKKRDVSFESSMICFCAFILSSPWSTTLSSPGTTRWLTAVAMQLENLARETRSVALSSAVRLIDRSVEGRSEEKVKQTSDWDLENEDGTYARLYKPDRNNDAAYFCCCASWGCRVLCIWPWMERCVVPAPARGPHSGPPGSILTAH